MEVISYPKKLKVPFFGLTDAAIFLLYFLYFRLTSLWVIQTFLNEAFWGYGLAFLIILFISISTVFRRKNVQNVHDRPLSFSFEYKPFIGLLAMLLTNVVNVFLFHQPIISALCFFLGFYCLLGFYFPKKIWQRGIFIALLLSMMLPLLPYLQIFLGFPLRLMTTKIISTLLHALHITNFSESTLIVIQDNATNVDLLCSGVKSLYTGTLFLLVIFYLHKVRISLRAFLVALAFYASLIFFNIWRVFSLVYIYDVLEMKELGDAIHVRMGLVTFGLSCALLWFLTKKYFQSEHPIDGTENASKDTKKVKIALPMILLSFLIFAEVSGFWSPGGKIVQAKAPEQNYIFGLEKYSLQETPFPQEKKYFFVNQEVELSKKYSGVTTNGVPFSLLMIASKSSNEYHNPETALQQLGYRVDVSQILQTDQTDIYRIGDALVRKVLLWPEGSATYWFVSKDKITLDYSERIWDGLFHPAQTWVLVEVIFDKAPEMDNLDFQKTVREIHSAVKGQLE